MDARPAPVLIPSVCFVTGLVAVRAASPPAPRTIPLLVLLALGGAAIARATGAPPRWRPLGIGLAFLSVGAVAGLLRAAAPLPAAGFRPHQPVRAVGVVTGHPRPLGEIAIVPFRLERLRWGDRRAAGPWRVHLVVPTGAGVLLGSRLRVAGTLGPYDRPANGARSAIPPAWRLKVKSRRSIEVERLPAGLAAASNRLRTRVVKRLEAIPPSPGTALVRALVLGDPSRLDERLRRGLSASGLGHLLAVSGLHLGIVSALLLALAARSGRRWRVLLVAAGAGVYLLLVGPRPSLVRAAVMAVLATAALSTERPPSSRNALAWAAVICVSLAPDGVDDVGFRLTLAATAGIVLLAPALAARWRGLPVLLRASLAASVGAHLGALPCSLPSFHLLHPVSPIVNLLAVPWTALVLAIGVLWVGLAAVSIEVAGRLAPLLDLIARPFAWPASTPWPARLALPLDLGFGGATLLASALTALLLRVRPRRLLTTGAVLVVSVAAWRCLAPPAQGAPAEIVALDVGQGDAILLRGAGRALLVDGGGSRGGGFAGRVLLPALLAKDVRRLDAVVMTHPDLDHCGGLVGIAAMLPVAEVWSSPGWSADGCGGRLTRLPGVVWRPLWRGARRSVGPWRLEALHPPPRAVGSPGSVAPGRGAPNPNDRSLVLLAEAHGRKVLLTADVGADVERRLVARLIADGGVDLLKLAHHGSRRSSDLRFLAAASPRLAVVSAGRRNPFGHPSEEVLRRLRYRRIPLLRTDLHGGISLRIEPDGSWSAAWEAGGGSRRLR